MNGFMYPWSVRSRRGDVKIGAGDVNVSSRSLYDHRCSRELLDRLAA
jgi:hypothetical protein